MTVYRRNGPIILRGYTYRLRLKLAVDEGATFTGQVRATEDAADILATLTTADGEITRVDAEHVDIEIPAAETATMAEGTVVFDMVRTDTDPDTHMGFRLTIPVDDPITRGLA
jgi:hypothetical protein